jgi:ribosomal protein S18 acetylase RimI-like enzyme
MPTTLDAPPMTATRATCSARCVSLATFTDRREMLRLCHDLARDNMAAYLAVRGRIHNSELWYNNAGVANFFIIEHVGERVGFVSTVDSRYSSQSLHISDLQLQRSARNCGVGSAVISWIVSDARDNDYLEISLNVFRENPAAALYRRHGFEQIHFDGDKIRMSKFL